MPITSRKPTVETLNRDVAALKADIGRIADTLAALAEQSATNRARSARKSAEDVTESARSFLDDANEEVRAALDQLKNVGRDAVQQARSRVAERRNDIEAVIHNNPVALLGIAAAAGFIVGMATRGRRERDDD